MPAPLDRFSGHAAAYARYRIDYPTDLYEFLLPHVPGRHRAWDCATGNGQVALALARYFEHVDATDLSSSQLEQATLHPGITYRVAQAETTPFAEGSFDLITVGQALHWFDVSAFHQEARRVLKPGGVMAEWGYGLNRVNDPIDALVGHIYRDVVGPFWDPQRQHIETEYQHLPFAFNRLQHARFVARRHWPLAGYLNYLRTWSAVQAYGRHHHTDPIAPFEEEFRRLWGPEHREVTFPIFMRMGIA